MKAVYFGTLYRFGYELTTIGEDETQVRKALIKAYNKAFKKINGTKPTKEEILQRDNDIEISEFTFGQVEWR